MSASPQSGAWAGILPGRVSEKQQADESTAPISTKHVEQSQIDIYLAGKRTEDARNRRVLQENRFLRAVTIVLSAGLFISLGMNYLQSGKQRYVPTLSRPILQGECYKRKS